MKKSFVQLLQHYGSSPAVQGTALAVTALGAGATVYFGGKAAVATAAVVGGCAAAIGGTYLLVKDGLSLGSALVEKGMEMHREYQARRQMPVGAPRTSVDEHRQAAAS